MFDELKSKFTWLDKHHRIERFGVVFSILLVCMIAVVLSANAKSKRDSKVLLNSNVIYTTEFVTSLSGNEGTVEGIYCDDARTKVFILLKFANLDNISQDATDYQMFLTGSSPNGSQTVLTCNPVGSIYMFEPTGYMGIYLSDSMGFQKQILSLTVRANVVMQSGDTIADADDASFAKHDQFRIYFNPGGADYTAGVFLNEGNLDAYSIYEECVSRKREETLRTELDASLTQLYQTQVRITEYTDALTRAGIAVPDAPALIYGDTFEKDENGNLVYYPAEICAGGFDFDWRAGSVHSGYLDSLCGELTYNQFFDAKANEFDIMPFKNDIARLTAAWYYEDGSKFNPQANTELQSVAGINNNITLLTNHWSTYYELKKTYQCTQMRSLLILERNAYDVANHYTINREEGVLTLY